MSWKNAAVWHEDGYYTLSTKDTGDAPLRLFLTPELLYEAEEALYPQLVTDGALCLGPVGFDIGCFTGDTLVPLADGKQYSMQELAERDEEYWVYALTPEHTINLAKATAKKTREDAPLVRVTLDNQAQITCTRDHQFMLRDGSWCAAKDLMSGASLMPFYSKFDDKGYHLIKHPKNGRWQSVHWVAGRAGLLGDIPQFPGQKTVIHHRSFTPSDNRPENLEFMGDKDHIRYHYTNGRHNIAQHRPTSTQVGTCPSCGANSQSRDTRGTRLFCPARYKQYSEVHAGAT